MDIVMFLENFHFRNEILELIVPIIMMAVDFITGSFSAWMTHTFQSARMTNISCIASRSANGYAFRR